MCNRAVRKRVRAALRWTVAVQRRKRADHRCNGLVQNCFSGVRNCNVGVLNCFHGVLSFNDDTPSCTDIDVKFTVDALCAEGASEKVARRETSGKVKSRRFVL